MMCFGDYTNVLIIFTVHIGCTVKDVYKQNACTMTAFVLKVSPVCSFVLRV